MSRIFRVRVLQSLRFGTPVHVSDAEMRRILESLLDLGMLSMVRAVETSPKPQVEHTLELAFESEIRRAGEKFQFNPSQIRAKLDRATLPYVKESLDAVSRTLNESLLETATRNMSPREARRFMLLKLNRMGVTTSSPHLIDSVVRTHTQMTYSAATWDVTQRDDGVWGYQYFANTERHDALDGFIAPKDDPIWETIWPPNGWNCQCQVVPVRTPQRRSRRPRGLEIPDEFQFNPGRTLQRGGTFISTN